MQLNLSWSPCALTVLNESYLLPLLTALLGATTGALLTSILRSWYDRRTKIRDAREALVGHVAAVSSDALAALIMLNGTRRINDSTERLRAEADSFRILGRINQLSTQVWNLFPEWYATMTFTQLTSRFEKLLQHITSTTMSPQEFTDALAWFQEHQNLCATELARAAKLVTGRKRRLVFHGFTKSERKRRTAIIQGAEDDPGPWECYVKCRFTGCRLSVDEVNTIEREHMRRLRGMKCDEHERAPHVRLLGRPDNLTIEIESCCQTFQDRIKAVIFADPTATSASSE